MVFEIAHQRWYYENQSPCYFRMASYAKSVNWKRVRNEQNRIEQDETNKTTIHASITYFSLILFKPDYLGYNYFRFGVVTKKFSSKVMYFKAKNMLYQLSTIELPLFQSSFGALNCRRCAPASECSLLSKVLDGTVIQSQARPTVVQSKK